MKKIQFIVLSILAIVLFSSISAHARDCSGRLVEACSTIKIQDTCGNYYIKGTCSPVTKKTLCTQCGACVAGKNNCIKGAAGCHKCNIATNTYQCGTQCSWGEYCSNGGGACSYKE